MRAPIVATVAFILVVVPGALASSVVDDLPCEADVGGGTSDNIHRLGRIDLHANPSDIDVRGNLAFAAIYDSEAPSGFDVVDVSDPTAPRKVAEYRGTPPTVLDTRLSPDGQTALVGRTGYIDLVDVSDPEDPRKIRSVPLGTTVDAQPVTVPEVDEGNVSVPSQTIGASAGPVQVGPVETPGVTVPLQAGGQRIDPPAIEADQSHKIHATRIDGRSWVFAASGVGTGVGIYELVGPPGDRDLRFVTQFAPGVPLGAHDTWVHHDPVRDSPVLYVANSYGGWLAADVSDPSTPVPLAASPNGDPYQGYTHSIRAQWIDGRRIVATIQESEGVFPPGASALKIYDATNLQAPVLIGIGGHSQLYVAGQGLPGSEMQHHIQIVDGRLYMAHYEQGVYVFDLDELEPTDLPRNLEAPPQPQILEPDARYVPPGDGSHFDVVLEDGVIYTSDWRGFNSIDGGLVSLQYGCIDVGDPAQTSIG